MIGTRQGIDSQHTDESQMVASGLLFNLCTDEYLRHISILDDSHVCHGCDTQETNRYASVMNIISVRMNHT